MLFKLVFWRFLISYKLEQLEFKLEKNDWDLETYIKSQKKFFFFLPLPSLLFCSVSFWTLSFYSRPYCSLAFFVMFWSIFPCLPFSSVCFLSLAFLFVPFCTVQFPLTIFNLYIIFWDFALQSHFAFPQWYMRVRRVIIKVFKKLLFDDVST